MQNWFQEGLPTGTLIEVSESGYITDEIAIEVLKHFIANTNLGPTKQWKLMLIDNHRTHCTPEFIKLAS